MFLLASCIAVVRASMRSPFLRRLLFYSADKNVQFVLRAVAVLLVPGVLSFNTEHDVNFGHMRCSHTSRRRFIHCDPPSSRCANDMINNTSHVDQDRPTKRHAREIF